MTSNLALSLTDDLGNPKTVVASRNDGSTFNWTPESCATSCALNSNTKNGRYSWYAATAGVGTSSSTGDVNGSICPAGWRLPANYTIDNSKSYGSLTMAYLGFTDNRDRDDAVALEAVPLSFSRAGFYNIGHLYSAGLSGYYWSSTASGSNTAYYFRYGASNTSTYPQDSGYMSRGFSARCVAL